MSMAEYRIEVADRGDGFDVARCTWDGREFNTASRNGAEMAIARALRSAGAPDGAWVTVGAGETATRLYGRSMHALAGLTVAEGKGRPRVVTWTPHPMAQAAE